MTILEKKRENEKFFLMVLDKLRESGTYVYPNEMAFFTKRDGKLIGNQSDLNKVKDIVTPDFFIKYFSLK